MTDLVPRRDDSSLHLPPEADIGPARDRTAASPAWTQPPACSMRGKAQVAQPQLRGARKRPRDHSLRSWDGLAQARAHGLLQCSPIWTPNGASPPRSRNRLTEAGP